MSHDGWQYTDQSGRYSRDNRNGHSNNNGRGFGSNNRRYYNEPTPFSNNSSSYGRQYHRHNNGSRNHQPTSFSNNYHGQSHRYDSNYYKGDSANHGRERGHWRGEGGGNRDTKKRDASVAAYESTDDSSKKPKSHQNYHRNDLSPEQIQYREQVASQQQDGETIDCIPPQAFFHQDGWEERKTLAAEYAKEKVLEELKKKDDADSYNDDDGLGSEYSYVGNKPTPGTLSTMETRFFDSLPKCTMMMLGFDIDDKVNDTNCWCPCCRQNAKWRVQNELDKLIDEDTVCSSFNVCAPLGLMSHLKVMGGVYSEKANRKMVERPMKCKFHYGTRMFLYYLYKDYHGDIGHKALYQLSDQNYKMAERAAHRKKEREKLALKLENTQLKQEAKVNEQKILNLQIIHRDLHEKFTRLQNEKTKLGIKKREIPELTEEELQRWSESITGQFATLRHIVDNGKQLSPIADPMVVVVEPDPAGRSSYLLQSLLDNLYDRNKDESVIKQNDFNVLRKVFFDDIPTPDEIAKLKERKKNPTKLEMLDISISLLSKWDVQFTKAEKYANTKKAQEQKKLDTAVDEGGPSKQFLSDAWKQMQTLAVPVLSDKVQLFQQATAGKKRQNVSEIIPIHDDYLIHQIKMIAAPAFERGSPEMNNVIEETKNRIYAYARVMGRLMLHSFVRAYPVSSAVMTPFYMNLLLRGITSGDSRYEESDIIDHMDGILCVNGDKVISEWLEEEREDGVLWEKEDIFSHRITDEFVDTCSLVLGGMMDGLSFRGRRNASKNLKAGSELCNILHAAPLDAVCRVLFSRPILTFEDVKEVLLPVYGKFETWEGDDKDLESYKVQQEKFYEEHFLSYIKDEAERDSKFLSKFVEACTGSCCLPYSTSDNSYVIEVEFNLDADPEEALAMPHFHACTNQLVFNGYVFVRGGDDFRRMMTEALESCWNNFNMT